MDKKRLETKVGLFVFIGLVLLAALMLQFSKGLTFFQGTYELRLRASNVGGLKARSSVLMSGVQVGNVSGINLAPHGTNVTIFLEIFDDYVVHEDAIFRIEQSGFLGDQYVAIVPTQNLGRKLVHGDEVACEEPFNLQEVARNAGGFIKRVDETTKRLNDVVVDVRKLLLNEQTLTNLAFTVNTLRTTSERALATVDDINLMFATNAPSISLAASNLALSAEEIKRFATALNEVLATNSTGVAAAVQNVEHSTIVLKQILEDAHSGKGAVGTLLHNEQVATNLSSIVYNLSTTTSNLNRRGLWGILWSQKQPRTNAPARATTTTTRPQLGKDPFD